MAESFRKGMELETAIRCEEVDTKQLLNAGYRDEGGELDEARTGTCRKRYRIQGPVMTENRAARVRYGLSAEDLTARR